MTARARHLLAGSVVVAGAVGLAVAALWINGIRTYMCDEGVPGPSGWAYAGLVVFALAIPVAGFASAALTDASLRIQQVYAGVALAEGVAAFLFAAWLNGKYSHYHCG